MKLFLDLDGVLVDLEKGLEDQLNYHFPILRNKQGQTEVDALWINIFINHPTFWIDLPLMEHAKELYQKSLEFCDKPFILTASPEIYGETTMHRMCTTQKKSWVEKHFGKDQANRTIVTKSKKKQEYIGNFNKHDYVLIDDHSGNINRWNAAKGTGILYKELNSTLKQLKDAS